MVQFEGYNETIKKVYDHNQEQVFRFWNELSNNEKKELIDQLAEVDLDHLEELYRNREHAETPDFSPAPYVPLPKTDEEKKSRAEVAKLGEHVIRKGKVAAFVVAGGQGSRLGYDGPKGKFPIGPVSEKTLFEIHAEKIRAYGNKYGVEIPYMVMTSNTNHEETVACFNDMNFFGLNPDSIRIFRQNMIPSLDASGKMVLAEKNRLFRNPDGHGGSLTAISSSGALDWLKEKGIECVSYFQVDNPLVRIIDPVFVGYHEKDKADITSKCLKKTGPHEKVGIFVTLESGNIGVVEYSDLSEEKAQMTDESGELVYSAGSPAIHLFRVSFLEELTRGGRIFLPYHTAEKKLEVITSEGEKEINGYKFEKFVFDALPLTDKNVIIEAARDEEFAPVKNATGTDSAESAREKISNLHRRWLKEAGIDIPDKVRVVEIAPSLAVEPEDLPTDLKVPAEEKVYLE